MKFIQKTIAALLTILSAASCNLFDADPAGPDGRYSDVAILFAAAFNNLSGDIAGNMNTICSGPLPLAKSRKAVIVCTHQTYKNGYDYTILTSPMVLRITGEIDGTAKIDTLTTFKVGARVTDAGTMRSMLEFVRDNFPAEHYQMVYSSHGTGYLPENYYDNGEPSTALKTLSGNSQARRASESEQRLFAAPAGEELRTKSIGCEAYKPSAASSAISLEMELRNFPSAIPDRMHFDSIIFDACLMGCIEVAYELRDCCDFIGFSQTEVLTYGFNYDSFCTRLLNRDGKGFCEDYFKKYDKMSGGSKSATISYIDCRKLDKLATVCKTLFEKYRAELGTLNKDKVQKYYRGNHPWFFDLEDMLLQCGATEAERQSLSESLNECVVYKAATEKFMGEITITHHSGFSTLLPSEAGPVLKNAYRKLAWNNATLLIQ